MTGMTSTTTTTTTTAMGAASPTSLHFAMTCGVLNRNVDGITHAESLQPAPGGGSNLNWVLGHVLHTRNLMTGMLGVDPVIDPALVKRYDRGTQPPTPDCDDAIDFGVLVKALNESQDDFLAALDTVKPERLGRPAPFSPREDPSETIGSLLAILAFHEAYHAGQTGSLRRALGKDGAIA